MHASRNPLIPVIWVVVAYVLLVFFCYWTGTSSQLWIQRLLRPLSDLIPSIQSNALLSPNREKAIIEISMAWLFSIPACVYFLRSLDWKTVKGKAKNLGGSFSAGIFFIFSGVFFLAILILPITPSDTGRFGRLFAYIFQSEMAFIYGAAIVFTASLAWTCFVIGSIHLYNARSKQGDSK